MPSSLWAHLGSKAFNLIAGQTSKSLLPHGVLGILQSPVDFSGWRSCENWAAELVADNTFAISLCFECVVFSRRANKMESVRKIKDVYIYR